jgi:hypothetical protein
MEGKNEEPRYEPADRFDCRKLSMEFADLPSFCHRGFCTGCRAFILSLDRPPMHRQRYMGPVNNVPRQFDWAAHVT